jgi:hypothetical protein
MWPNDTLGPLLRRFATVRMYLLRVACVLFEACQQERWIELTLATKALASRLLQLPDQPGIYISHQPPLIIQAVVCSLAELAWKPVMRVACGFVPSRTPGGLIRKPGSQLSTSREVVSEASVVWCLAESSPDFGQPRRGACAGYRTGPIPADEQNPRT